MIKQLIRQTIELLRHNVLLSVISILGTAFAICLIMVMVIAWQVKYRGAPPETNLERTMLSNPSPSGSPHRMDGILRGIAHRH